MNVLLGRPNKPNALGIYPGQDATGKYTKKCTEFADQYGWTRAEVCTYWSQIALAAEFHGRTRPLAEDTAWHALMGALHKHGEPD